MVANNLIDDEAQELLAEFGIKIGFLRKLAQPRDLAFLARWIGGGKGDLRFVLAHCLRDAKALGQHMNERRVDIVDALAIDRQLRIVGGLGFLRLVRHMSCN